MTDDELLRIVDFESQRAAGYLGGDLANDRAKALDYYHGKIPDLTSREGESDMVSTDVRDAVDGMLPDLMEIFLSSADAVKFEPHGPEDDAACSQATDAVNHIFYNQNPGALILLEWQKTALLEKNAFVKYGWRNVQDVQKETYQGLNDLEMQQLVMDPDIRITGHNAYLAALSGPQGPQPLMLHDVQLAINRKNGKCVIEGVPPENMLVSLNHASLSLRDVPFIGERGTITASRLMEMEIDPEGLGQADGSTEGMFTSPEWNARRRLSDERFVQQPNVGQLDPALKEFSFLDCKIRVDWDGDGIAELRRVMMVGRTIVLNEDEDDIGYAAICPDILPYRFYGLSMADLVMDIMRLKTVIWRESLNSLYLAVRPRLGVMESVTNLDDLLVSRAGGIVRFKVPPSQAMAPLDIPFVGQQAFPMMEYADAVKENRTGFTRYSQGTDASSLNKTATGISLISGAAGKRMRMIARMFAETGMKDLFRGILHMTSKYNTKPMTMRLRNQWVNVDPRQWKTSWDMTVHVGIGAGDRQQELSHLQTIAATQQALLAAGMSHMVSDTNLYNTGRRIAENAGFRQDGEFFTAPGPENPRPQQPPPPEVLKIQSDEKIAQAQIQADLQKKQMEVANGEKVAGIQAQSSVAIARINAGAKMTDSQAKLRHEAAMKVYESGQQKDTFDPRQAMADAHVAAFEARIKAAADIAVAQIQANAKTQAPKESSP